MANSLVGVMMSDLGIRALALPEARMSIMGNVKEAVFPVPVWAHPSKSLPININGIACSWMGWAAHNPLLLQLAELGNLTRAAQN